MTCASIYRMNAFFLSDTYLLRGATLGDVDAIQGICEYRTYEPGEAIVTESDKSQDIMVVAEGKARVETREGDLIDELRVGAMIGEIAFLDGKNRTANVFSVGQSKVCVVPAVKLRELMKQNTPLEVVILRNAALALCQRLREANQQVEAMLVPR